MLDAYWLSKKQNIKCTFWTNIHEFHPLFRFRESIHLDIYQDIESFNLQKISGPCFKHNILDQEEEFSSSSSQDDQNPFSLNFSVHLISLWIIFRRHLKHQNTEAFLLRFIQKLFLVFYVSLKTLQWAPLLFISNLEFVLQSFPLKYEQEKTQWNTLFNKICLR